MCLSLYLVATTAYTPDRLRPTEVVGTRALAATSWKHHPPEQKRSPRPTAHQKPMMARIATETSLVAVYYCHLD